MISMHVSSNQSAVRTGYPYLTSLLPPTKSHMSISAQPTGEVHWCAPICCHTSSTQVCHASPPPRKGRCANSFSERVNRMRIGHSPLLKRTSPSAYSTAFFLTWHGVAGPRDTLRSSPQRCCPSRCSSITLEKPSRPWTDSDTGLAQQSLLNIVLRPSPTSRRNRPSETEFAV